MKKIEVTVKDKNTIVLEEDAKKGDYIDLTSLTSIDFSTIEKLIEENKDAYYEKRLKEYKERLDLEYKNDLSNKLKEYEEKINKLNYIISSFDEKEKSLIKEKETEKNNLINDINLKNKLELEKLNNKINELTNNQNLVIDNEKLKIKEQYENKINEFNFKIEKLNSEKELLINKMELDYNQKLQKINEEHHKVILEKDSQYQSLLRQKSALNVKQTGEDLEAWCNNEMRSYRQLGLFNTTWTKDNDVVKDDFEAHGSKADYIFKIYATDELNPSEELASVCLDMKDENPDSVNKQTNEHYFKSLDKNRNKKNCKYAVLVSNLELDKPNDLPIYKAEGYDDMYVVRPAYMMTFLTMINSLTIRFKNLIIEGKKERLELMNSIELKNKFEELKTRYLDKPLESLSSVIEDVRKQSDNIKKICLKIDEDCDKATRNYLNEIQNKLARFEIETDRAYKRFNKNGGNGNEVL